MLSIACCKKNDAPIALISGVRRGAPRSGRYATRSSPIDTSIEVSIPAATINSSPSTVITMRYNCGEKPPNAWSKPNPTSPPTINRTGSVESVSSQVGLTSAPLVRSRPPRETSSSSGRNKTAVISGNSTPATWAAPTSNVPPPRPIRYVSAKYPPEVPSTSTYGGYFALTYLMDLGGGTFEVGAAQVAGVLTS